MRIDFLFPADYADLRGSEEDCKDSASSASSASCAGCASCIHEIKTWTIMLCGN
jgi:hypothetical protein